jgi:hypothetical protein
MHRSIDFFEEHIKNVWELGYEMKFRVLSGMGMTFDLALNKLAGIVAPVEALEFYEVAGEEYKAVSGDQHSHDECLNFTDMCDKVCSLSASELSLCTTTGLRMTQR